MVQLTASALQKMKDELEERTGSRGDITAEIKKAREMGDLRENASYHEAKDKQGFNEGRIKELEALIQDADLVEETTSTEIVGLGSFVKLELLGKNMEVEFQIVSFNEADPSSKKISDQSPLGIALLGKKINEIAEVEAPSGIVEYKIITIK